jgi:hypothetical protein
VATTNSKPPGVIIMINQSEILIQNEVQFITNLLHSFLEAHNCIAPFTSHGKLHGFGAENPIS